MILFVLEPSMFLSVSHDCVTVTVTCYITLLLLSKFKIKKNEKNKIKPSPLFTILTYFVIY